MKNIPNYSKVLHYEIATIVHVMAAVLLLSLHHFLGTIGFKDIPVLFLAAAVPCMFLCSLAPILGGKLKDIRTLSKRNFRLCIMTQGLGLLLLLLVFLVSCKILLITGIYILILGILLQQELTRFYERIKEQGIILVKEDQ